MLQLLLALGLVAGLGFGLLAAATGSPTLLAIAQGSAPLGTLFLNAIRMVVIPLVMAVVFTGVAKLGDPRKLGGLVGRTLAFFWVTLVPAILLGMAVMHAGLAFSPAVTLPPELAAATHEAPKLPGMIDFLVGLVPANPFAAAASGSLLPLIVFSALVAAATGSLPPEPRERLVGLADAVTAALIRLVNWVLWTAPIGIFGLAAPATARMGWALVESLAIFVVCVIAGLTIYVGALYLPLDRWAGKFSPREFLRATFGGAAIAFSTTSTAAALPAMLEDAHDRLRLEPNVVDVVLPLGSAMYRPGSALFQGAAIVFLAHLYRVPIPPAAYGGALLATFLVSLTVAPVPSSSVVTLAPALDAVGIPLAGLAILLGVDRIPDMFRTATNSLGQTTTAVVMSRGARRSGTASAQFR